MQIGLNDFKEKTMHVMGENTKQILRAILDNNGMTRAELREIFPTVVVDSAIGTLQTHKLIETERGSHKATYTLTPKAKRKYSTPKGSGVIAAPRAPVSADHYTTPKQMAYRPGAMDAYSKPSRTGETFTPYTRPLILASKVQSTRFP